MTAKENKINNMDKDRKCELDKALRVAAEKHKRMYESPDGSIVDFISGGKFAIRYLSEKSPAVIDKEDNNGWVEINVDKPHELPQNNNGNYFVYSTTSYPPYFRIDIFTGRILNTIESGKAVFSHYQPIIKPQPPIY